VISNLIDIWMVVILTLEKANQSKGGSEILMVTRETVEKVQIDHVYEFLCIEIK
jgi:hypothetical protein